MARLHPEQIAIRFVETSTTRERRAAAEDCALEHWDRRIELPGEEFLIMGVAASHQEEYGDSDQGESRSQHDRERPDQPPRSGQD